jgi:thiamine transporter 2/3
MFLYVCSKHFYLILLYFVTLIILVFFCNNKEIFTFFLNFINSAEVAKHLNDDSCGLIFGVNTFVALVLQTVLTVIVVDEVGLALLIRTQVSNVLRENLVLYKVRHVMCRTTVII